MASRNFRQYALGFGSVPAAITATLDGVTIFNGGVTTQDRPKPALPDSGYAIDNVAFEWTEDSAFSGTKTLSISVTGSPVQLAATLADNPNFPSGTAAASKFWPFYSFDQGGVTIKDPLSNVMIDGQSQTPGWGAENPGQWWYWIPAGSTLTATLNISSAPAVQTSVLGPADSPRRGETVVPV